VLSTTDIKVRTTTYLISSTQGRRILCNALLVFLDSKVSETQRPDKNKLQNDICSLQTNAICAAIIITKRHCNTSYCVLKN